MPNGNFNGDIIDHIEDFIGETVTVFTTSSGPSGSGFTGVLLGVNDCFIRLLTQIGPPPGCALGNACDYDRSCCGFFGRRRGYGRRMYGGYGHRYSYGNGYINSVGSVTDIPFDSIVSFVHNTV